jgi:hypothetical protein
MPETKITPEMGTLVQNTCTLWATRSDFAELGEKPAIWGVYVNPGLKSRGYFLDSLLS